MARSLIIDKTTAAMKRNQKSVPNISETASDYACMNFATHLIEDLSTDTVDGIYRVDKADITNAEPVTPKTTGTITLSPATTTKDNIVNLGQEVTVTYNGDGQIEIISNAQYVYSDALSNGKFNIIIPIGKKDDITTPATITVAAPETDNYTAATATFTITA